MVDAGGYLAERKPVPSTMEAQVGEAEAQVGETGAQVGEALFGAEIPAWAAIWANSDSGFASNIPGVPASFKVPSDKHMIRSLSRIVSKRWAMVRQVHPRKQVRKLLCTNWSVAVSMLAVASSSRTTLD